MPHGERSIILVSHTADGKMTKGNKLGDLGGYSAKEPVRLQGLQPCPVLGDLEGSIRFVPNFYAPLPQLDNQEISKAGQAGWQVEGASQFRSQVQMCEACQVFEGLKQARLCRSHTSEMLPGHERP